jgi:heme/copper-type cytochrome/quinol oxidase subunit 3
MSELSSHATEYAAVEEEPPEVMARNLGAAAQLLASASAFFFLAFLFAYFYLRSVNNGGLWRPKHVDPSVTFGTLVTVAMVASAVVLRLAAGDQRVERSPGARLKMGVGFALGVVAVALQAITWARDDFGPADGGYASVFLGWTGCYVLFVVIALFWLETLLATAIRYRNTPAGERPPAGHASGDSYRAGHDIADPLLVGRSGIEACSFYWTFLAGLAVVTWVVLYLL